MCLLHGIKIIILIHYDPFYVDLIILVTMLQNIYQFTDKMALKKTRVFNHNFILIITQAGL
jgi:hypothetical protein